MSSNSSLSRSSDSSRSLGEDQREALYLMLQQEGWQVYLRLVQQDLQSVLSRLESQEDPTQLFRAQGELAAEMARPERCRFNQGSGSGAR